MADINENGTAGAGTEEKKFTQADVDAIIEGRLAREKQKYADYEDLKEKAGKYEVLKNRSKTEAEKTAEQIADLQKQLEGLTKEKTVSQARSKVAAEMKVPVELLTGEDEETCKKQAKAILNFAKPTNYPGTRSNNKPHTNESHADDGMRAFAQQLFGGK